VRPQFLDALPISESDRAKLRHLGASSPAALLSMRQANPDAFDKYVGEELVKKVIPLLLETLSAEQLRQLEEPLPSRPGLGARMEPPVSKN